MTSIHADFSRARSAAALDLVRICARTLRDERGPSASAVRGSSGGRVASPLTPGVLDACVDALVNSSSPALDRVALTDQVRASLLADPAGVVSAIDRVRGAAFDYFDLVGARKLQYEMLNDAVRCIALSVNVIQSGRFLSTKAIADLKIELTWLSGGTEGALSAVECLRSVLPVNDDCAEAARAEIWSKVPAPLRELIAGGPTPDAAALAGSDAADLRGILSSLTISRNEFLGESSVSNEDVLPGDLLIGECPDDEQLEASDCPERATHGCRG